MSAFPVNWRTGGIGWGRSFGIFSLYVCFRFGDVNGKREAKGFIIRYGKPARGFSPWMTERVYLGCLRFHRYPGRKIDRSYRRIGK